MKPNKNDKRIDTDRVVDYLTRAFSTALDKYRKVHGWDNVKGTTMYDYQVDFCYLINSIQRDHAQSLSKTIQEANQLIERLEKEV